MSEELIRAEDFTEEDIALALRTIALVGGNCTRAATILESEGREVSHTTLRKWKDEKYPVQYEEIVYNLRESIGSKVSDGAMEVATQAQDLSAEMVRRLQENLHEVPTKDLAKAALNVAQTSRTNVEVARLLRNQPNSIVEVRSVDESLDRLKELDVIDVDVVEESTLE